MVCSLWHWPIEDGFLFHSFSHLPIYAPFFHPSARQIIFEHLPCLRHHSARWNSVGWESRDGVLVLPLPLPQFPQRGEMTWQFRALSLWYFIIYLNRKFDHCLGAVIEGHFTPLENHEKCTDGSVVRLGTLIYVNIQAFFTKLTLFWGIS